MNHPWHLYSASDLGRFLRKKEVTSVELTQYFIDRIKAINPKLNAFITLSEEEALAQAASAQKLIDQEEGNLLCGVPFAHKDIFCTQGIKTTCGSKMLENFIPPYNATVTQKLYDAGLVMLGKTNMDEFAMGSANSHSYFGPCSNPYDLDRVPGGSSGGSAAAVAAGMAPFATGSDTGGSIRQPASYCNLVGIKPTYGRISRYGMIAFASSLDQAGVMTTSVEDSARLLEILCGHDPEDSTSSYHAVEDFVACTQNTERKFKIGIVQSFVQALDEEGQQEFHRVVKKLMEMGHTVEWMNLDIQDYVIPTYYVIAPAEASSNLARYDGVRYGYRCHQPTSLEDLYTRTRTEGFGEEVKRRILMGTYVLSAGYYDAYYQKALHIREMLKKKFSQAFQNYDLLATPTALSAAFKHGAHDADPVSMYYSDLCTVSVNLADLPGISLPLMRHQNLPLGFQLIAKPFDEGSLLCLSAQLEKALPWSDFLNPILTSSLEGI